MTVVVRNPERDMQIAQGSMLAVAAPAAVSLARMHARRFTNAVSNYAWNNRGRAYQFAQRAYDRLSRAASSRSRSAAAAPTYMQRGGAWTRYRFPIKYGNFRTYRLRRRRRY